MCIIQTKTEDFDYMGHLKGSTLNHKIDDEKGMVPVFISIIILNVKSQHTRCAFIYIDY